MDINKKFFFTIILFSSIVLCSIAGFNYYVDSANIYHNQYVDNMAKILLSGENVAGVYDYDERRLNKILITDGPDQDVLVLGSSTIMWAGESSICSVDRNYRVFNYAVPAACLDDMIVLWDLYKKNHPQPKVVILGIDAAALNENWRNERTSSLENKPYDLSPLISFEYTKASAQAVRNGRKTIDYYATTAFIDYDKRIKSARDGSLIYAQKEEAVAVDKIDSLAKTRLADSQQSYYKNFYSLEGNRDKFENFLDSLQAQGVRVVFYLPPFHPIVWEQAQQSYPIFGTVENYLKTMAVDRNIPVVGSYDPDVYHLENKQFLDGAHLKNTEAIACMKNDLRKAVYND